MWTAVLDGNTELENRTEDVSKFLDNTLRGNRYEQRRSNQHSSTRYRIEVIETQAGSHDIDMRTKCWTKRAKTIRCHETRASDNNDDVYDPPSGWRNPSPDNPGETLDDDDVPFEVRTGTAVDH